MNPGCLLKDQSGNIYYVSKVSLADYRVWLTVDENHQDMMARLEYSFDLENAYSRIFEFEEPCS